MNFAGQKKSNINEKLLKVKGKKKIFTIFTNVMWDAQIFHKNSLFTNQFEWIEFTINTLIERKDVHTVIRIHPGEANIFFSKESILDTLSKITRNINPENLTIIKPNDSYSSYELLRISQLSIIYGSKISLESAYRNIPTLICGDSIFK